MTNEPNIDLYNIDINKMLDNDKKIELDEFIAMTQPIGSIDQATSNTLYGLNHTGVKSVVPENRDSKGYVFFTRPQLNFSTSNLANVRRFYSLLSTDKDSVHRYVRCMLDPRVGLDSITTTKGKIRQSISVNSNLVDDKLAYIPVLTNTLLDMSGWPDMTVSTFASKQGVRKEQYVQIDSSVDIYESFDLDCTFRNIRDEPIVLMMQSWLLYAACVFEGIMNPYHDMLAENEIDYNTRIYRLIMDETGTYVKRIAATGASFPINVPTGKLFDFTSGPKYMDNNKELNIRFKCVGAIYDDILIKEFNDATCIFNQDLKKIRYNGNVASIAGYEKIPRELRDQLNHRGYPLINRRTFELEWWIEIKHSKDWNRTISLSGKEGGVHAESNAQAVNKAAEAAKVKPKNVHKETNTKAANLAKQK